MRNFRFELFQVHWREYLQLMRADKPIGTMLLAYPVLWSLILGGEGRPQAHLVAIFLLGTFLMRSAGCVINDFADRNFDHAVSRTQTRPLTSGKVNENEALSLFIVLIAMAACLLFFLPILTFKVALLAVAVAIFYPFSKRFFLAPQLVLGVAFSMSIPMSYVASKGQLDTTAWLLFFANTLWTIMYDTWYALVDKIDDEKLNIHSTAITFGRHTNFIMQTLKAGFLFLMVFVGIINGLNLWYYVGLLAALACFIYQYLIAYTHTREACFQAFLNNRWVGIAVLLGILLAFLP